MYVEVRGEFFNATNTVRFSPPNTSFGNSSFGTITGQANSSRHGQIGARSFSDLTPEQEWQRLRSLPPLHSFRRLHLTSYESQTFHRCSCSWNCVWRGKSPASLQPGMRRRENFNAGWLFRRQAHGGGALGSWDRDQIAGAAVEPAFREAQRPAYDDSWWEPIYLPHTWNAQDGCDDVPGYFRGIGWYRKHFQLDGG